MVFCNGYTVEEAKEMAHPVLFTDSFPGYDVDSFYIPTRFKEDLCHVLIPQGMVRDRTKRLAQKIIEDIGSEPILALCVLKGAYRFFNELLEEMKSFQTESINIDFIRLKSYVNMESSGQVSVLFGEENVQNWHGRNVLIVEDIIDTGRTMKALLELIESQPKAVRVASLLVKRTPQSCGYRPDYIGFEIPNRFVVGCAFDYNEHFRDLNHVCVLNEHAKQKYAIPKKSQNHIDQNQH